MLIEGINLKNMSTELPKNKLNPESEDLFSIEELDAASKRAKERGKQKESAPRRKLFLTVDGLMIDMRPKRISEDGPITIDIKKEDLDDALFYFGCTRDEFFNFEKGGPIADQLKFLINGKGLANFRLIKNAVEKAEKEERVIWRKNREHKEGHSYDDLNTLLTKFNMPNIEQMPDQDREADFEDAIKDQIEELGLPLDVVG